MYISVLLHKQTKHKYRNIYLPLKVHNVAVKKILSVSGSLKSFVSFIIFKQTYSFAEITGHKLKQ